MKVFSIFCARVLALTIVLVGPALAVSPEVMTRGWKPPVEFLGAGNPQLAVTRMREMAELQDVVFNNSTYHKDTRKFIDNMWESLESFNLKKFYKFLPMEDGPWRTLSVFGHREGKAYYVGPSSKEQMANAEAIESLGDVFVNVKAKKSKSKSGSSFLIDGQLELGIGSYSWDAALAAAEEAVRLIVEGDPGFSAKSAASWAGEYRKKVKTMNPELGDRDVQVLAPFSASYPESWNLLAKLGRVNDVVVEDDATKAYQHLNVSFTLDPDLMEAHYPALADHVDGLDELIKADIEISNEDGRLVRFTINSETLRGSFEAYISNGRFLPYKDGAVVTKVRPLHIGEGSKFTVKIDSTMDILGIIAEVKGIETTINYQTTDSGAIVLTTMKDVPDISIKGAAFGLMPAGFIDLFLPTNIDELMRTFLTVAVEGNDGKGIEILTEYSQLDEGKLAKVKVGMRVEALNNFMVRIGMWIVNKQVVPNKAESEDVYRLIYDVQEAFAADLTRFEKIVLL
ncbi:MAG: hypothetical protein COA99_07600 [Moraxellaceae bacterium]|nr:MAG: hypothetical protein COA99_07600 [Moraxellaceae bacterium]